MPRALPKQFRENVIGAVKDVFSNRIVGYSVDSRMKTRPASVMSESHRWLAESAENP